MDRPGHNSPGGLLCAAPACSWVFSARAAPGAATRAGSRRAAFPLHGRLPGRRPARPCSPSLLYLGLLHTDYIGRRFVYRPSQRIHDGRRPPHARAHHPPKGAVVLAETQTAGRGRAGRAWVSPPDVNLYLTVLLFPQPRLYGPLPSDAARRGRAIEAVTEARRREVRAD